MTTITVSASDTAQAMDKIVERLGEDAMILETIKRNGRIEMIATNDPDEQPAPMPRKDKASIQPVTGGTIPMMQDTALPHDAATGLVGWPAAYGTDHLLVKQVSEFCCAADLQVEARRGVMW